jgi:hypothetical protein
MDIITTQDGEGQLAICFFDFLRHQIVTETYMDEFAEV